MVPGRPVRVLVATRPVDFRKGMDGLTALVREHLRDDRSRERSSSLGLSGRIA